jgi:hypothetical protein
MILEVLLIICLASILVCLWYLNENRDRVAIVSLVKEPHAIRTWVDHHKDRMNIDRFYIFADDDNEDLGISDPKVQVIKNWKDRLGYTRDSNLDEPANVRVRQELAFSEGQRMAARDGIKYLVHIDSDELLWGRDPAKVFAKYPESTSFHMKNEELAPDRMNYQDCFMEGTKFHSDPTRFTAYGNGKAAGLVGQCEWHGPHYLKGRNTKELSEDELRVLHYPSCNIQETLKRARQYGNFKDDSAGWSVHHRETRDALANCGEDCEAQAREVFTKRMAGGVGQYKTIDINAPPVRGPMQ